MSCVPLSTICGAALAPLSRRSVGWLGGVEGQVRASRLQIPSSATIHVRPALEADADDLARTMPSLERYRAS